MCAMCVRIYERIKDFEWITTSFVKAKILKYVVVQKRKNARKSTPGIVPLGTEVKHINKRTE